ncbi:hypothetical protein D9M68_707070 [compost metagenome]
MAIHVPDRLLDVLAGRVLGVAAEQVLEGVAQAERQVLGHLDALDTGRMPGVMRRVVDHVGGINGMVGGLGLNGVPMPGRSARAFAVHDLLAVAVPALGAVEEARARARGAVVEAYGFALALVTGQQGVFDVCGCAGRCGCFQCAVGDRLDELHQVLDVRAVASL